MKTSAVHLSSPAILPVQASDSGISVHLKDENDNRFCKFVGPHPR